MKVPRIEKIMNDIDSDMILNAEEFGKKKNKKQLFIKWGAIAACVCMISACAISLSDLFKNETPVYNIPPYSNYAAVYWGDYRERNEINVIPSESAIEWPWEYRADYEKFTSVKWNGNTYYSNASYRGNEIIPSYVGTLLDTASAEGYCLVNDEAYNISCEIFELVGLDSKKYIAVKLEGSDVYYPFCVKNEFKPPATLGELINRLSLKEYCKLNVAHKYDLDKNGREEEILYLDNKCSNELWDIISKYSSAEFISYRSTYKTVLSFSVTSSAMGFYNKSFAFTNKGFIITNIEDYRYAFYVGEDAIEEIVNYVISNKTDFPTVIDITGTIAGTVTEIGEDYIKINDSVFMKNPDDGIEFTVKTTDIRIKRYIDLNLISVGSQVIIRHKGIYEDNPSVVDNAFYMDECIITANNEILIPE